jgi:hypothetical protein
MNANETTLQFRKIDIDEMIFPARFDLKVASANSLKEDGTSQYDDSYCLIATSAMKRPDIKLTMYITRKREVEQNRPGPLVRSGNTIKLGPTVLVVTKKEADKIWSKLLDVNVKLLLLVCVSF